MAWHLVHTVFVNVTINNGKNVLPFLVAYQFSQRILIIEAICDTAKPSWYDAGWIRPIINIPNVGNVCRKAKNIDLAKQEVDFNYLLEPFYKLEFIAKHWLPNVTLKFWENDGIIENQPSQNGCFYKEQYYINILAKLDRIEAKLGGFTEITNFSTDFTESNSFVYLGII